MPNAKRQSCDQGLQPRSYSMADESILTPLEAAVQQDRDGAFEIGAD